MSLVHLFPGQGSQRVGMGADLFDEFPGMVATADRRLGHSLRELCLADPDGVLDRTEYTQPALFAVGVLDHLRRRRLGEVPMAVAGHSLGEYCALFAAGAFDFETGIELVRVRGALMSAAPHGAMAAVVKLRQDDVRAILDALPGGESLDLANINSATQCVVSGPYDDVLDPRLREACAAAGGVLIPLKVSAAFHSRGMREVQERFAEHVLSAELGELALPVIANVTARPYPSTGYQRLMIEQISNPVRWYESVSWLLGQGYDDLQEVGPGKVLTRLAKDIRACPADVSLPAL